MKIFMTGSSGMLGNSLLPVIKKRGWTVMATARNPKDDAHVQLDITDHSSVTKLLHDFKPDVILHCAALTNVDYCEREPEEAFKINTEATKHIARIAKKMDIPLVFISTGAVFTGDKDKPYVEDDPKKAVNVYGQTKLDAEHYIRKNLKNYLIVRTGWLIGGERLDKKFVAIIMNLIKQGQKTLQVIADTIGSPTLTNDLAEAICLLIEKKAAGVYHVANPGMVTRPDIVQEILGTINAIDVSIEKVASGFFGESAKRPKMEALNVSKVKKDFNIKLPSWKKSLRKYVTMLKSF